MAAALRTGAEVSWNWGAGKGEGKVAEVFTRPVSRSIRGKRIRRRASPEKPAYLVVQADGGRVLKSHSELSTKD